MHVLLSGILLLAAARSAQAPIRLEERLTPNMAYHVSCRVQLVGKMSVPDKTLDIEGKSEIEYDERILRQSASGAVDKTLRLFAKMEFERKIGSDQQKLALRPAVHRLVILRQNNIEAPFSPDALLKLTEIDLIRTDVFTPALAGLLPKGNVVPGDTWKADEASTRELTDLTQITAGELNCRFDKVDRHLAKISFFGSISGVGENGPTRHDLDGFCYFDLNANMLTYVSLKGTEHLANEKERSQGKVTGTFVLTREPKAAPAAIAPEVNLVLDPNEDNTRLLFEDDEIGVRFAHSRKWKPRIEGSQVRLEDLRGNGMVLSIDALNRTPTMQQFLDEARLGIQRRKATVAFVGPKQPVQREPTNVEMLSLDVDMPADAPSQRGIVVLAIVRDEAAGATLAATLLTSDRSTVARDVERIATSIRLAKSR
jgi:hypothetical protein